MRKYGKIHIFPYADLFDEILCDKSIYYAVLECDDVYLIFTPSFFDDLYNKKKILMKIASLLFFH